MKRIIIALSIILALSASAGGFAAADTGVSRIALMTVYMQQGWGDCIEAGFIDENGGMWYLSRKTNDLGFPYETDKQLDFLMSCDAVVSAGKLETSEFWDAESLIECVAVDDTKPVGAACDAGTQKSVAIRYGKSGEREIIPLGISGDYLYENRDANAQALYALLRKAFPGVTDYDGESFISPAGFIRKPVVEFLGLSNADFTGATVEAYGMSCEAGPTCMEITKEEGAEFIEKLSDMVVTGKKNAVSVTGGTTLYILSDRNGDNIASVEFYDGALVRTDGMYFVE